MNTSTANKIVVIEHKTKFDFEGLKKKLEVDHWRKFHVVVQIREKMHGGKPVQLDAAKAMLKARGLEDIVEAREAEISNEVRAESVVDEGLCAFHQREGKPGCWWPSNNFKACLKENWSVLGYNLDARPRSKRGAKDAETVEGVEITTADGEKKPKAKEVKERTLQGSKGYLREGVFVVSTIKDDRDWIYLGPKADGIDQNVSHTTGPKGPQSAIKRNEYFWKPKFELEIWIARHGAAKIPDETLVDTLLHAQEHGIGANRSQGMGKFDVVSCEEMI